MRRGWTMPEMLVALVVTSLIVALAAGAAVGQQRIYRGIGEVAAVRTQVGQAALIAAGVLRDLPGRRHIVVATDSSIEVAVGIGVSVTCQADTGRVVVARPNAGGHTFATFTETPQPGDGVEILAVDSTVGRLEAHVAAAPAGASCARFPAADGWSVALAQPFVIGAGMPVRFTRRVRVSAYRAADGEWYLGLREWNPNLQRFNTVQPVAGPLLPHAGSPPGFRLEYRDASGNQLSPPDPASIAVVTVIARGDSRRPVRIAGWRQAGSLHRDSAVISVSIR